MDRDPLIGCWLGSDGRIPGAPANFHRDGGGRGIVSEEVWKLRSKPAHRFFIDIAIFHLFEMKYWQAWEVGASCN